MNARFFASLATLGFTLAATAVAGTNEAWSVRVWQADSLSDRMHIGMVQTDDGFLWVATASSLVRFDGFSFQEFPAGELVSQPSRQIRAFTRGKDGSLALAFESGLVARLKSGSVALFTNTAAELVPETLLEDAEGSLWLSARDPAPAPEGIRHVCRIKQGMSKWFTDADGLPRGRYFLARDAAGQIWFARDGDVGVFRDDRFQVLTNLPSRISTRITGAVDGGVWLASGLEIFRYDPEDGLRPCGLVPARNSGTRPTVLFADSQGALWIATSHDGMFRYHDGSFESVPSSDRAVFSLMEDRERNIWAATRTGLNRLQPKRLWLEGAVAGAPSEFVRSLCEDTSGVLWATTHNGLLAVRTNDAWRVVSDESDLQGLFVKYVASDPSGGIWIGTGNHKLLRWHDGHLTTWGAAQGVNGRSANVLQITRRGDVWVAWNDPDMLQCVRGGTLHTVELPPGRNDIRAIEEDAAGDVWFGLYSGALLRARGGAETVEKVALPSAPKPVLALHGTADGSLWIGFKSPGLGRLKNERFGWIGPEQGFLGNRTTQIQSDGLGSLWFGSDQGLFRVLQSALDNAVDHRAENVQAEIYASGPELSPISRDAGGALRSRDGRLWIPLGMTLATIRPEKLNGNLESPHVVLKRVVADGVEVAECGGVVPSRDGVELGKTAGPLRLNARLRKLEFEFAALCFREPENVHFRYRLEGFDEKWIEVRGEHSATYSRLAAGEYRFHVTACNSDGVWSEPGAVVGLSIPPLLWQRRSFQISSAAVLALGLIVAVRYVSLRRFQARLRELERQAALDQERARIARDIHDDLGGNLTKILLLTELTLRDRERPDKSDRVPERVREISGAARQIMKSLDETVWAIDPGNDTLPDLITYLSQFAVGFLQSAGVRCHIDVPDRPPDRALPANVRHHLFLAAKEALTNLVRHAHATEATLRIAVTDDHLMIRIEDNGRGFAGVSDEVGADGLRNMRLRMDEISGQFQVESIAGSGTHISLTWPWKPASLSPSSSSKKLQVEVEKDRD